MDKLRRRFNVYYALEILSGLPIIRAVITQQDWPGWALPVPSDVGLAFAIMSGAAFLLTVVNLALKGLGAPFAIALSRKLAVDWLYAWTRNPMVLAALAFLLSLGIFFSQRCLCSGQSSGLHRHCFSS
jgi:protein-S-isoprenylcysteine O-methyltransferase Ste14